MVLGKFLCDKSNTDGYAFAIILGGFYLKNVKLMGMLVPSFYVDLI